jgi:hypothetical protein
MTRVGLVFNQPDVRRIMCPHCGDPKTASYRRLAWVPASYAKEQLGRARGSEWHTSTDVKLRRMIDTRNALAVATQD